MPYNLLQTGELDKLKKDEPERFRQVIQGGDYINLQGLSLLTPEGIDLAKMDKLARVMRALEFIAIEAAQSGHPGGSSSKTEQLLSMVLGGAMSFDATNPKHVGRDRVVWSAGHCSPGLYSGLSIFYQALRLTGTKIDPKWEAVLPEDLIKFRSSTGPQGHIENYYPLSDVATGPSGHGLSAAGGMAAVHRSVGLNTKVWVFMGDAETEEGMTYEARNLLATNGLNNTIVTLDYNHFGIDGNIDQVISSPYINHWLGLGWNVIEVNGHNWLELIYAYNLAAQGSANGNPTVVLCHAIKGKFYGAKANSSASHGSVAKHEDYVNILKNELGFNIPGVQGNAADDISAVIKEFTKEEADYVVSRLNIAKQKIEPESVLLEKMNKALAGRPFVKPVSIRRPEVLPPELIFEPGKKVATRKATSAWFKWLMQQTAFFYAGTGDLSGSILTSAAEEVYGLISRSNPLGRGVRFGIAEQNMAMWSAALTQDVLPGGFQPVSVFSSYAVFTSMMTNCVRLALIGNHLKPDTKGFFIMLAAHDGPETGEDGPTHQGMYWMSMFNAYPGIKVYKPMDANETIEMLFYALAKGEPIALSVGRPDVPVLDRVKDGAPPASEAVNGAYVYHQFKNNGKQKVVLAVCGTFVLVNTLQVLPELENTLDVKIIAVTSPELYEELCKTNPSKAKEILSDEERPLVVALHNGWKGFLYPFLLPVNYVQHTISIDNYLKSGKVDEVYALAKMSPGDIKERILKAVKY